MNTASRITSASAGVAIAALALTACSGSPAGGGGDEDGGGAGDNKLTVWAWDPAFNIFAMEEAAKVYQGDHPDFELDVQEVPWDDLQQRLTTIAQAQNFDELPDIFLMQNNAFQKNIINYPDLAASLDDSGVDFSQFPESVVDYSTIDDVHYGVPFDAGTAITALRTDVLEEAGYTIEDFTDITWDTFIAQGKDVLEKTGKPLLSGQSGESDLIMMILQSAGASLFDDEGNPTIKDNEVLIDAIETYGKLVESGLLLEVNSWDEYVGTLVNDQVVGALQGIWIVGSIQTATDQSGNWQITNIPKLDGVSGATNYSANGGSSWTISSTANYDLAADFLKETFAGSEELYDTILPPSGAVANWLPAGGSSVYAEPQEFFGGQSIYQDVVEFASEVPSNNTGAYYYEARDAVSVAAEKITGGANVDDALDEAQSTVEFAMQ